MRQDVLGHSAGSVGFVPKVSVIEGDVAGLTRPCSMEGSFVGKLD
jgi:hypothetical protein